MIVGLEGLDGVGKTTIAKAVAEHTGGIALSTSDLPEELQYGRKIVNEGTDATARFRYFKGLNVFQMRQAQQREAEKRGVVTLESTAYRTYATHRVLGVLSAQTLLVPSALWPTKTFYLDIPEEDRLARITERDGGLVMPSHWDQKLYDRSTELRSAYADFDLEVLDATQPVDVLVEAVIAKIQA